MVAAGLLLMLVLLEEAYRPALLAVIGLLCEILGVVFMAHQYFNFTQPWRDVPRALISGLWRGEWAKNAVVSEVFTPETHIITIQGLSLIAVGFCLQTVAVLLSILPGT